MNFREFVTDLILGPGTPTGVGNYPPGVTDNDPHFSDDYFDDDHTEDPEPEPPTIDPQTGFETENEAA